MQVLPFCIIVYDVNVFKKLIPANLFIAHRCTVYPVLVPGQSLYRSVINQLQHPVSQPYYILTQILQ